MRGHSKSVSRGRLIRISNVKTIVHTLVRNGSLKTIRRFDPMVGYEQWTIYLYTNNVKPPLLGDMMCTPVDPLDERQPHLVEVARAADLCPWKLQYMGWRRMLLWLLLAQLERTYETPPHHHFVHPRFSMLNTTTPPDYRDPETTSSFLLLHHAKLIQGVRMSSASRTTSELWTAIPEIGQISIASKSAVLSILQHSRCTSEI
jgi:hypothetical protein